jgi:hypothetical protein
MHRFPAIVLLAAASAAAQDHIIPFGFSANTGGNGGTSSMPAARIKDNDLDGQISSVTELHSFLTTAFYAGTNAQGTVLPQICFMTDVRAVVVDGEYEFYFTDTEQGRIVRGVDKNHNGLLDRGEDANGNGVLDPGEDTNLNGILDTEVNEFVFFGERTNQLNLLAPDTLAVYRDNTTGRTRVYVALDNNSDPTFGFVRGIYRCVDNNGDGDAKDPGETTLFVSSTLGLTVPGTGGPVALNVSDNWTQLRCLPGGKLIAYAQGNPINTGNPIQPSMNAFYGFTDNNGTAVPEVWFNCSNLNSLPRHPDWVNGTYPDWDASYGTGLRNFARWVAVAPRGYLGAIPAYYIASSYNVVTPPNTSSNPGDMNLGGQHVAGLIYRVVDLNQNQVIDPGELTLYCNMSGQTYAGVAPVGFTNHAATLITSLTDRTWGFDVSADGEVSFIYANGVADGVVTMRDLNNNNVIDAGEAGMVWAQTTTTGPLSASPFFTYFGALADGTLPGPFPTGITTSGSGCLVPSTGMRALMDSWGGPPQVGNLSFKIGSINGVPFTIAVWALGTGLIPPVQLGPFGFPAGCTLDIDNGTIQGFGFTDAKGRTIFAAPLPPNNALIGLTATVQAGVIDLSVPVPLQYFTTNALVITIQP